jgi:hypothetical protein
MILSFNFDHYLTFFNTIIYDPPHDTLDSFIIFIGLFESIVETTSGFIILAGFGTERLNPLAPTFFIRSFIEVFRSVNLVLSSRTGNFNSSFRKARFCVGGTKSQAFFYSLRI